MANEFIGLIRADVDVWAADLEKGRELLSVSDACVRAQSPFDRCARIGLPQLKFNVTVEMYLAYLTTQALAWSAVEISALKGIVRLSSFADLLLPGASKLRQNFFVCLAKTKHRDKKSA